MPNADGDVRVPRGRGRAGYAGLPARKREVRDPCRMRTGTSAYHEGAVARGTRASRPANGRFATHAECGRGRPRTDAGAAARGTRASRPANGRFATHAECGRGRPRTDAGAAARGTRASRPANGKFATHAECGRGRPRTDAGAVARRTRASRPANGRFATPCRMRTGTSAYRRGSTVAIDELREDAKVVRRPRARGRSRHRPG